MQRLSTRPHRIEIRRNGNLWIVKDGFKYEDHKITLSIKYNTEFYYHAKSTQISCRKYRKDSAIFNIHYKTHNNNKLLEILLSIGFHKHQIHIDISNCCLQTEDHGIVVGNNITSVYDSLIEYEDADDEDKPEGFNILDELCGLEQDFFEYIPKEFQLECMKQLNEKRNQTTLDVYFNK